MKKGKVLEGIVTSDKSNKTVTILVSTKISHHLYTRKTLKRKKYKAHDKDNMAKIGDRVRIVETRPYSKEKHFRLLEVLK